MTIDTLETVRALARGVYNDTITGARVQPLHVRQLALCVETLTQHCIELRAAVVAGEEQLSDHLLGDHPERYAP